MSDRLTREQIEDIRKRMKGQWLAMQVAPDASDALCDMALLTLTPSGEAGELDGKLWSLMRSVLCQGTDIHKDYMAGKYANYEEFSARIDCAARERADELAALRSRRPEGAAGYGGVTGGMGFADNIAHPLPAAELDTQRLGELIAQYGVQCSETKILAPCKELADMLSKPLKLDDIEQYRMQMAGICTAALGYWKEGDSVHPDYDTPALRDVAKLYAKYAELHAAREAAAGFREVPVEPTVTMEAAGAAILEAGNIRGYEQAVANEVWAAMLAAAPIAGEGEK